MGVDVGGTKIYAAVFNQHLQLLAKARHTTKADRGVVAVVERIVRTIYDAIDEADLTVEQVEAIGIGAPGVTDPDTGTVLFAPNLGWHEVPLAQMISKRINRPVIVENDCNAIAYGVFRLEFKGEPSSLFGIFIGTGIGGGIILRGHIYRGFNKTAGEIGHMVLDIGGPKCSCGNKGCFEALASRRAILREIKRRIKKGEHSILPELASTDIGEVRSKMLLEALKRGDKVVREVISEASRYCGIAVRSIINVFSPEVVVLGGGVIEALRDYMLPHIEKTARKYAIGGIGRDVRIVATQLGDDAGVAGCAALALERIGLCGESMAADSKLYG